jgi:hypothetical protein
VLSERGHVRWGGCIVLFPTKLPAPRYRFVRRQNAPVPGQRGRGVFLESRRVQTRVGEDVVAGSRKTLDKAQGTRPRGRRARLSPFATLVDVTISAISARNRQKETRHRKKKTVAGGAYMRLICSLVARPPPMARDVQFSFCEHIRPPLTVGTTYIIISRPCLQVQTSMIDCAVVVQPAAPARSVQGALRSRSASGGVK